MPFQICILSIVFCGYLYCKSYLHILTSEIVSIVSYSHHYFSKSVTLLVNIVFHTATDLCIFLWMFCRYTFLKFWWNKKTIDSPPPQFIYYALTNSRSRSLPPKHFLHGLWLLASETPFPHSIVLHIGCLILPFLSWYMWWTGACMHVCVCMWRSEDNSRCHSLGIFHSLVWDKFSYWPVTLSSKLDWVASLAENASICHQAWVFTIVLRLWTQVFTHVRQALYWQCPWNLQV